MNKIWTELDHSDYVYVRRNGDHFIVSTCINGKSQQTTVTVDEVKHSPTDLVIVAARRLLQRLKPSLTKAAG